MKRIMQTVVLTAALAAVLACGGSGNGGTTSTTADTTALAAKLEADLLTVADVGPLWQLGHAVNDADFTDAMQLPCADAALNPSIAARLLPTAGVQFEPVDHSNMHLMELARTGPAARLATDLDLLREAIEACTGRHTAGTDAGTVDVAALAIPELGDQRFAMLLTGTQAADAGVTWYVRVATVRVGTVAIDIRLTEILDTPSDGPQITDAAFVGIVEQATSRINR
ncbi:MAG: hypothetical protein AB7O92_25740 [Acidimicrobiia bacterium]